MVAVQPGQRAYYYQPETVTSFLFGRMRITFSLSLCLRTKLMSYFVVWCDVAALLMSVFDLRNACDVVQCHWFRKWRLSVGYVLGHSSNFRWHFNQVLLIFYRFCTPSEFMFIQILKFIHSNRHQRAIYSTKWNTIMSSVIVEGKSG